MIKLKDILSEIPPEVLKAMSSVDRDKNLARGCGLVLFIPRGFSQVLKPLYIFIG